MEPITREEYYLAKIAGTYEGNTPEPVTIEEYYLATMAGDYSGNTPQPVTRLQYYMAKVAGVWGGSIPAPVTRLEYYWAAIASGEGKVFPPVTREEHFLVLVADAYSVVLTVVTGNPALLENSKGNRGLESLTLYGKSTQGSTTGANILKDTYLSLCKGDVDLFTANGLFTANSNYEKNVEFNLFFTEGSIFADSIKDEETYYIAFRPIGFTPVYRFQLSLKNGAHEIIATSVGAIVASVSGAVLKRTARILLYFFNVSGAIPIVSGSKFQMIFSKNPDCIYEPYTGGAPSPSPSYPQEIESAGQNGEIEVEVLSGNLFDKSAAYDLTQSGGWSASFDGEELKVVCNNITIGSIRLFNYKKTLPAGTYTFSISKPLPFEIRIDNYFLIKKGDTSATVTFDNGVSMSHFAVDAEPGATFNEQRFKIMLNAGSTALPYELYKPAQTLIIPTSGGLPGIRVSSGGNYTDADGQQWVCDEVDFKKGVYVQRVAKEIPNTSLEVRETPDVKGRYSFTKAFKNIYKNGDYKCLISHGIYGRWGTKKDTWAMVGTAFVYSPEERTTEDKLKEKILSLINSDNPLTFLGQLETPIEIPLTTEQLAKYKALRTYSPTTTVINDAGAGMSVGYAKMK